MIKFSQFINKQIECSRCHGWGTVFLQAGIPNIIIPCPKRCKAWKELLRRGKIKVCKRCGKIIERSLETCPICYTNNP